MKQIRLLPGLTMVIVLVLFATTVSAADPYAKPDNTWINISGTVQSVSADAFALDYGHGRVIVEMDDGDRHADAYKLLPGDKVTVNGMIDDDFFERTTIEASSVYVEKLGTFFFAGAADEEDGFIAATTPIVVSATVVQGVVTEVNGAEFKVDSGLRTFTVDVDSLPYDPLDDEGYLKIGVGDTVRVTGRMDEGFFEERELEAESILKLME